MAVGGGLATFVLDDYPVTRAVLDGKGMLVAAADPNADPRERAILDAAGFSAVLMAGARDATGRGWLVEIFVDDISTDVTSLPTALRALTSCALTGAPDP